SLRSQALESVQVAGLWITGEGVSVGTKSDLDARQLAWNRVQYISQPGNVHLNGSTRMGRRLPVPQPVNERADADAVIHSQQASRTAHAVSLPRAAVPGPRTG